VEAFWPTIFAKLADGIDLKALISNVGAGGAPAAAAPAAAAPAAAAPAAGKKEEKKEEKKKEESEGDMGFSLFD